jgi:hypothetical protein
MPGFGSGPFGSGPFGSFGWSKQVLFNDLPELDRRIDQEVAEGRLELFVDTIRPSFDELGGYIRDFGHLRDPDLVRSQYQRNLSVNLLIASSTAGGRTIEVLVEKTDPNDPFDPLEDTSIGWILEDDGGRWYTVNTVHKLWSAGPMVELQGAAELPVTAFSQGFELAGLVTFTEGSATVTGSGTTFLADVSAGQYLAPSTGGGNVGKVQTVVDNFTITLTEPWGGSTATSVLGVRMTASEGPAVLRPPALLPLLGQDFNIEVDQHQPESYQRSSVRNAKQWLIRKGAQRGYDIIGKISGYRVVAQGLWRLASIPSWLSPDEVFEIPPGEGKYYTTVDPLIPFFDEIAADVIPLDYACRETPNWTTDAITPPVPSPPDGTSVEDAIGIVMENMPIISTTDLGSGRWRIRVGPGVDLWPIAAIGYWYANFVTMAGQAFYLEAAPVEVVVGTWEFEILAGASPTFGSTVSIDYECHFWITCDYCRASLLRIEVVAAEVLSEPEALLGDAMGRLSRKILQAVPVHVRTTDIVHVVGPVQIPLNPSVQTSTPP